MKVFTFNLCTGVAFGILVIKALPGLADVNFTGFDDEDPRRPGLTGTWTRSNFGTGDVKQGQFGIVIVPNQGKPPAFPALKVVEPPVSPVVLNERAKTLFARVHFDFDKSDLSSDAKAALGEIATLLAENSNVNLVVDGHTDRVGSVAYNIALGQRRADSVRGFLTELGVPNERLITHSYGKSQSVVDTEERERKNRRAEMYFEGRPEGDEQVIEVP